MTRWTWMSLLGLLLLAFAPCRAQEDLRLYHEALYLEHVAHQPEKALAVYRKICKEFPGSPFRRNALVRQADLLRKLHRPEEAKKILAILSKEGLAREARKDISRLEKNARRIKEREALLEKLKGFRKRLQALQARLDRVRKEGAPPGEVNRLEKQVRSLKKSIDALKPRLMGGWLNPFWVKKQGLVPKKNFREARKLSARILELRKRYQALRAQGKAKESAQVLAQLKKVQARLEKLLHSFRAHRRGAWGPRRIRVGFPGLFLGRGRLVGILLSPRRLARLDQAALESFLKGMDRFVAIVSGSMQRRGRKDAALRLRMTWTLARRLYEKRSFTQAAAKTRVLLGMLPWRGMRPPVPRRPTPGKRPAGKSPAPAHRKEK